MSIIFQLFSAEDLQKLDLSELEALRETVLKALQDESSRASRGRRSASGSSKPPETVQELTETIQGVLKNPPKVASALNARETAQKELRTLKNTILEVVNTPAEKLFLNLTEKTEFNDESPPDIATQEWVREALAKRFHEVYLQLKAPSSAIPPTFDYDKLIDQGVSAVEELILRWAISCELNHLEFYDRLLTARKAAYPAFIKMMQEGKGPRQPIKAFEEANIRPPDSKYSPFNPRSPLYRQYVESSRSASKPPQSYPPPTS
jgi:hypothetical protein